MSPENTEKLKQLLKQFLNNNNLHLYKEIWANHYSFKDNQNVKDKEKNSDYVIERFVEDFTLSTDKDAKGYKFFKFVYKNDIALGREIVPKYIDIPKQEYLKEEYIEKVIQLYTNDKKENHILWSIVQQKKFLNNNIKVVEKLFKENVLGNTQKQHIVNYYVDFLNKNIKFNNLENKRIVSVLNESLTKPLNINLLETNEQSKVLNITTKTSSCVYFEVKVQELMGYNLKFSNHFAEHLLENFNVLLPQVVEAETQDVITRIEKRNNETLSYHYAVLTNLNENIISKVFAHFVDSYLENIDNDQFLSKEDMLDCLKFSVVKARKDNLENKLVSKNITTKVNKI